MNPNPARTLHMIGHGHIDPTWLWRWTEGFEEVRATFRSALDRMNETPDFCFTASSACFYEWVRQAEPAMFAAIQARVAEGRWEIAGGFWIEPDCNLPAGESFIRQGLYGQRFFQHHFGKRCRIGFHPDSFGHAGTLPQILRGLGLDHYIFMRPMPDIEMAYPGSRTFWWEGPDGSRVLTSSIAESYNADAEELTDRMRRLTGDPHLHPGQTEVLCFFGVGNHGGGPTKRAIASIQDAPNDPAMPKAVFSTLEAYFDALRAAWPGSEVPTVAKELQYHARGCFSVHAGIKRWMRRAEHRLLAAERWASVAMLEDLAAFPKQRFDEAWHSVLYNQFHDILAGSSIASSYEDARDQLGAVGAFAEELTNRTLQTIARDIDTTPEGNTVVVFNALPWPVHQPVLVSPIVSRCLELPLHAVDADGNPVDVQEVRGERVGDGQRFAFIADTPALGYACYHLRSGARPAVSEAVLAATPQCLENRWWRIDFDPWGGHWSLLHEKERGLDLLHAGALLTALNDHSDTWSHGVVSYRSEAGRFGNARLRVAELGTVLATVRSVSTHGRSEAQVETTLYRDHPAIDLRIRVNWQESYQLLKVCFESAIVAGEATYEAPYGVVVRRATGDEEPGQRWCDVSGRIGDSPSGLTILNDGQYAFDVWNGITRITLLRSPAYAHHDPFRYDTETGHEIMDQGWHEIRLRLLPHGNTWQSVDAPAQAWAFNTPPVVHVESAHPGRRAPRGSFLECRGAGVVCSVLKQQEESHAFVVRLHESHGADSTATLSFPSLEWEIEVPMPAHSIKTLCLDPATRQCAETNFLEEAI
jgi:alpha-mannosidase